jgi:hypothetical protein
MPPARLKPIYSDNAPASTEPSPHGDLRGAINSIACGFFSPSRGIGRPASGTLGEPLVCMGPFCRNKRCWPSFVSLEKPRQHRTAERAKSQETARPLRSPKTASPLRRSFGRRSRTFASNYKISPLWNGLTPDWEVGRQIRDDDLLAIAALGMPKAARTPQMTV